MKIAFFEIEDWEIDYLKTALGGNELFFSKEKLNKDNLPEKKDFDAISVFVGSEIKLHASPIISICFIEAKRIIELFIKSSKLLLFMYPSISTIASNM